MNNQKTNFNEVNTPIDNKVRVATYSRTSSPYTPTNYQLLHLNEVVTSHSDWEPVASYTDECVSPKSAKNLTAFNQMLEDAPNGNFDLIVTYEISRFARSVVDAIQFVKKLKAMGIGVLFIKENINSLDPDGEFILAIISYIAQEESRRHSERVKAGIRAAKERKAMLSDENTTF